MLLENDLEEEENNEIMIDSDDEEPEDYEDLPISSDSDMDVS